MSILCRHSWSLESETGWLKWFLDTSSRKNSRSRFSLWNISKSGFMQSYAHSWFLQDLFYWFWWPPDCSCSDVIRLTFGFLHWNVPQNKQDLCYISCWVMLTVHQYKSLFNGVCQTKTAALMNQGYFLSSVFVWIERPLSSRNCVPCVKVKCLNYCCIDQHERPLIQRII